MKEKYMREALKMAKMARSKNEIPVGAIVIYKGKIIARAYNKKISNGLVLGHAEIIAIKKASKVIGDWRLNDCEMYVTLEPCPMCAGAIQQARIKKLYYGASSSIKENTKILRLILKNPKFNHSVIVEKNLLNDECTEILNQFFKNIRR